MYVQSISKKTQDKTYTSFLVIENYREGAKVKHRTIANISKLPMHAIEAVKISLKSGLPFQAIGELSQGKSFGAIKMVKEVAKKLGITEALGDSENAKLAIFQIAGRIIAQRSRNYLANEWRLNQDIEEIFGIESITEDDLYENLDWLCENQNRIENKLFRLRTKNQKINNIYLYDVTSSYFEGAQNELAEYGYNRDKKKGKKQIVIGLLTDDEGYPVSVKVFKGNTQDPATVSSQLEKLKKDFGVKNLIFVGDKGMIKSSQMDQIQEESQNWHYLTSITKEQIKTLINKDVLQLSMFDDELIEIENDGSRYILRKNKARAAEIAENRSDKINKIKLFINQKNIYLSEHPKAKPEIALKKVEEKIQNYKFKCLINTALEGRTIKFEINETALSKTSELDGCYVLKTDVPSSEASKEVLHSRYKDLSQVEFAFRTLKTTIEEIRPIFVRKESRTRGHVFVAMLAYLIVKYMTDILKPLNYTRAFIIDSLDKIHFINNKIDVHNVKMMPNKLLEHQQKIIDLLEIKICS
jgi:transposase